MSDLVTDLPAERPAAMAPPAATALRHGRPLARLVARLDVGTRLAQLLVLGALIGAWQLVAANDLVNPLIAKTPSETSAYLREAWSSGELQEATVATMTAVLAAFVLASVVGATAGIALGLMPRTEKVLSPFLDAFNAMSRIAFAPVFIIWFGITTQAKVALAFTVVVFVLLGNARAGVRAADPEILRLSSVLGASKPQLFRKVLVPVAVPAIFAGLRLGLIYALLGVVASEIIAARVGLGQLIAEYSSLFRTEAVYGILLVLAVIASVLNALMRVAESRLLRWQPPASR